MIPDMATGDYCTLAQLKENLMQARTYTNTTLAFVASSKTITDTQYGLRRFQANAVLQIAGSTKNNGVITVATGNTPNSIVVNETLVDEAAGASVTITDVSDPIDDTTLATLITAVSRLIEKETGRIFYKRPSTGTETRYYTAVESGALFIDDCVSISELATDDTNDRTYATIWSPTDYDLNPYNAPLEVEPEPYTQITRTPNGLYYFPNYAKGVRIKGVWGWSSVPAQITQAALLQTQRWFKRKDAIFGVMGSADMGQLQVIPKIDPDVSIMLKNYRKLQFG